MPVSERALEKRLEDIRTLFSQMRGEYDNLMEEQKILRSKLASTDAWQLPTQVPHPKFTPEALPVKAPSRHEPVTLELESVEDDTLKVPGTVFAPRMGALVSETLSSVDEEILPPDTKYASAEEILEDYLCARRFSDKSLSIKEKIGRTTTLVTEEPFTTTATESLRENFNHRRLSHRSSSTDVSVSERKRLFQSAHKPLGANRIGMFSGHSLACLSIASNHGKGGGQDSGLFSAFNVSRRAFKSLRHMRTFLSQKEEPIIARIEKSFLFRAVCIIAICTNTVWVGVQADDESKRRFRNMSGEDENEASAFIIGEYTFTIWFTLELIIRIAAVGMDFVQGDDRWWNVCDAFLVLNSYVGIAISLSGGDHPNLQFVRILRVFRLIRVVRVVRHVKALGNLRTLVFSIINSFVNLLWALLVIILIIFIFGVIFQNAVSNYFSTASTDDEKAEAERINTEFGSLYKTMTALFCAITGGNDWMMYAELLRSISDVYFLAFAFYVAFAMVGLLNVVTGIFVDSAVCTRTEDEVIETWRSDQKRTEASIRKIFKDADTEEMGHISLEQFEVQLADPRVRAYFAGMELDAADARSIFRLLDRDRSNRVDINEFVNGTMKLKGHAKQVDVMSMMYDNVRQQIKLSEFCEFVENELLDLRGAVNKLGRAVKLESKNDDTQKSNRLVH
mmetsp:Transcript_82241/g.129468  ORF Transcript_82241/g.129468 Transcript_82241/m.129468 type:complete len:678 (-) Transcript_82241:119-2152(-)